MIDIGDALDLLTSVVNEGGSDSARCQALRATHGESRSIVWHALSHANVTVEDVEAMRGHRLRDLYRDARLPVALTLGALIVLDAAQQSEDHGSCADDALDDATGAAARFLDLVALVPAVTGHLVRRNGRCELSSAPGSNTAR